MNTITTLLITHSGATAEAMRIMLQIYPGIQLIGQIQDSRSAQALVKEWRPDLVILDFRLPQEEIEKTMGMIREQSPGTITVAVIENQLQHMAAARAKVAGVLTHHFTFDELQLIINKVYVYQSV